METVQPPLRQSLFLSALSLRISASVLIWVVLALLMIYIPRVSSTAVCVQVSLGNFELGESLLVDVVSGRYHHDKRFGLETFVRTSPDEQWTAYLHQNSLQSERYTLYAASVNDGTRVIIQTNLVPGLYRFNSARNHVLWYPDSRGIMYMWHNPEDGQVHLSSARLDGTGHTTVPFTLVNGSILNADTILQGWSSTGDYFSIAEKDRLGMLVSFWTTAELQRVSSALDSQRLHQGLWSPSGTVYAGLQVDDQSSQLILLTLDQPTSAVTVDLPGTVTGEYRLVWSPNGSAITVVSAVDRCAEPPACGTQWRYDVVNTQGEMVAVNLRGSPLQSDEDLGYLYTSDNIYLNEVITGTWTPDSQQWVYIREQAEHYDLVAVNVDSSQSQVLATNLVPEFLSLWLPVSVWDEAPFQSFTPIPATPFGNRMLIFRYEQDQIMVELADTSGSNRQILVQEADAISLKSGQSVYVSNFWSPNSEWVVVPATLGTGAEQQLNLAVARSDGSEKYLIEASTSRLMDIEWVMDKYLGYRTYANSFKIAMLELETGIVHELLTNLDEGVPWNLVVAPNQSHAAVMQYASGGIARHPDLWLVDLKTDESRQIRPKIMSWPVWSPDSARLAFITSLNTRDQQLEIIDPAGHDLRQIRLPEGQIGQAYLTPWTDCS